MWRFRLSKLFLVAAISIVSLGLIPAAFADGVVPTIVEKFDALQVQPGRDHLVVAECPNGLQATGGGFLQSQSPARFTVGQNYPTPGGRGWRVQVINFSNLAVTSQLTVYAICM